VLYAPLGFFLQNPVGEMLVAFTKDQDIIDENLMDTLHYLGIYGLIMLSTVITVSVVVPFFAAFGAVLILVTIIMLRYYLPAATALKKQKVETAGEFCCWVCVAGIRLCWGWAQIPWQLPVTVASFLLSCSAQQLVGCMLLLHITSAQHDLLFCSKTVCPASQVSVCVMLTLCCPACSVCFQVT
jgi:ABC-type multidrug transport system fused ATPase/permease subunit